MNIQDVRLDIDKKTGVAQWVTIGQGDKGGTTIRATVFDNGVAAALTGMSARFELRMPNATYFEDTNCTISGNVITYVVDESHAALYAVGENVAYFALYEGETAIYSTERFHVRVARAASDGANPGTAWTNGIEEWLEDASDTLDAAVQAAQDAIEGKSITSATVTVGTGTGTPTASASVTQEQGGKRLALAFDGLKGATGATGADGVSCEHSWNGTVLTMTSASGTSSADLRGPQGPSGYVLTPEDKAEIIAAVEADMTQTLIVTCVTQDNVTVTGQTVTLRDRNASGAVMMQAAYEGQPVSFTVPMGAVYHVSVTDALASHFSPTHAIVTVGTADMAVTLTYSDMGNVQTGPDLKGALNSGADLSNLIGETISCGYNGGTLDWVVAHYATDSAKNNRRYVDLFVRDCSATSANQQFEPPQALMWCESGLSAGAYTFKWNTTQVYLTLTAAIPSGGQLVANSSTFKTYVSQSDDVALEVGSVSTTEIVGATDLGKTGTDLLNHHDRVTYGSNNVGESALWQWLNSTAAANTPVTRVTKLSRPKSYDIPGFMAGLDQDFIDCVEETVWRVSANSTYECPSSLGGITTKGSTYTLTAKFGLLSEREVFGSYSGPDAGDYQLAVFVGSTANDRKFYRGTAAQYVWLRSPSATNASIVRDVNTSGAAYGYYANGTNAVVPACRIYEDENPAA